MDNITGIILAGGKSQRMGYNKALAILDGKPLIEHVRINMMEVSTSIYISNGSSKLSYMNLPMIEDEHPNLGPLGGIYSALKSSPTVYSLILSCDMPLVTPYYLRYLAEEANRCKALITIATDKHGRPQPLCGIYHRDLVPFIETLIVQKKLKLMSLLEKMNAHLVEYNSEHSSFQNLSFISINTPEALLEAQKIYTTFHPTIDAEEQKCQKRSI
jgi:Molybdopterin-guanine dinucleotide biosynthesis protein A